MRGSISGTIRIRVVGGVAWDFLVRGAVGVKAQTMPRVRNRRVRETLPARIEIKRGRKPLPVIPDRMGISDLGNVNQSPATKPANRG